MMFEQGSAKYRALFAACSGKCCCCLLTYRSIHDSFGNITVVILVGTVLNSATVLGSLTV